MEAFTGLPSDFETSFKPSTQIFRLFDLPDELWLLILRLSITRPYPIDPTWAAAKPKQALIVAQPAITRTCRLLRTEGLPLYYSLNTFESQHRRHVACTRDWMVAIGQANRKAMGRFWFCCEFESEFWVGQFAMCGIEVRAREAEAGSEVAVRMARKGRLSERARTLEIEFV